ncbi:DUF6000 family protein [Actinomadura sp. WMMB 499]|uniref:DUF6000 family protein n=1 Tax=Actinomadura sp. WMMB 499 TaxID=1219491 RepID=UPI0012444815|nr:DUF6000 family protein [Actinomadura sp. WMMB 499]QFG22848.1 hypothetical protein F7P10_18735 [Actinomadura sp. WMMB 499]
MSSLPGDRDELIRRYVVADTGPGPGRYLKLLHGNFTGLPDHERSGFLHDLRRDAQRITDAELEFLLHPDAGPNWRERITAAWLIGLDRRTHFRGSLGRLLLESRLTYAGQGYCFALARFGDREDADVLVAYLEHYLPRADCVYDQHWAIGALLRLDDKLETDRAERILEPGGLWHRSGFAELDPFDMYDRMTELCDFADGLNTAGP